MNKDWDWERQDFWLYLLALGFDPGLAQLLSDTKLQLGPAVFDTPNYSAFHIVIQFLFTKLDKKRAEDTFRGCLLPDVKPADSEFRKCCYSWLKEIATEEESGVPQVGSSLFLSPAGHKFVHLMYRFARHVVVKDLRKSSAGSNESFVEAVGFSPEDMCEADERCRVACNELLLILLKKHYIIQKHVKTSRSLIKEIKQMKSEHAHLQQQLQSMEPKDENKNDRTERIQKVRSMWTLVVETFTSLKNEMEIVDSVLEGRVGQYILDGANVVVSVPALLVDKVERETQQVCTGNLYEDEKLNFLTVIQLLNEALRILRDEYRQFELENYLQPVVNMTKLQNEILLHLDAVRQRIEKQCWILNESNSVRQKEWIMKWKSSSGWSSLHVQDLGLDMLQAVPEAEDSEDSIVCQNPESVSDILDVWKISYENDGETLESKTIESPLIPTRWISSQSSELSEESENKDLLTEKGLHIETDCGKEKPPKISQHGKDELTVSESQENSEDHVTLADPPVKKEDVLEKVGEELAEEVAKAVTSDSPQSGGERGGALDDLINSLDFHPFVTRKQIPQTPENLLIEIRNSWRKAIQSEDLSAAELVSTGETVLDASPAIRDKGATSLGGASSSSAVSDYPSSEWKSQGSSTEFTAQKQISQISESLLWEETYGMLEGKSSEEGLEDSLTGKTEELPCVYMEKSLNTPCISSENDSKMNILPSNHLLDLVDKDLRWNASPGLSSDSCEIDDGGILNDTIPEELNSRSPNKSVMSESSFDFSDSLYIPDNTINKGNTQNLSLDLDSLLSRYEMLKKNVSGKGQELHQIPVGDESLSNFSDESLTPEDGERDDLSISLEHFSLDEEFTKITSPGSLSDKNSSLSSLLAISKHLEVMSSDIHEIPLDLIHKLKDEELNEKLSTKE